MGQCYLLVAFLGLNSALPFQTGDTIEPGLYRCGQIARAVGAIKQLDVIIDSDGSEARGVWVRRPTVVSNDSAARLEIYLRASGVFISEFKRPRDKPCLFVSTNPNKRPRLGLGYRATVFELRHAKASDIVNKLHAEVDKREKSLPEGSRTRFTADERSQKIIVRYNSEALLDAYRKVVAVLDVPDNERSRPKLERWRARSMKAAKLEPLLAASWKESGRAALNIVVHAKTNSLLIRLPVHLVPDLHRMLQEIDPQPQRRR